MNIGIIRNRLKIEATVNNAKAFIKIQKKYGSFSNLSGTLLMETLNNSFKTLKEIPLLYSFSRKN